MESGLLIPLFFLNGAVNGDEDVDGRENYAENDRPVDPFDTGQNPVAQCGPKQHAAYYLQGGQLLF